MTDSRKIIHIDMDAFFASVEELDNPKLRGLPLIVGGEPTSRGVVAACSYAARAFGVHSAMPSAHARRLCPAAIFVRPRMERYRQISQQIMSLFFEYTNLVEPLSLDEAFLDVTVNTIGENSATRLAEQLRARIARECGLTASAGVSCNKVLAKVASGLQKPNGLTVIPPDKAAQFVAGLPVRKFFGVGQATERKMQEAGISTGADLLQFSQDELCRLFGKNGLFFYAIARGIDHRAVQSHRERKSIGTETTFARDILAINLVQQVLQGLVSELAADLTARKACGRTLTLKVRYHDFATISRSCTLASGFTGAEDMEMQLPRLLAATEAGKRPIRLLGISVSNLLSEKDLVRRAYQLPLPFPDAGWPFQWQKIGR